jgi:hypothetical protein
MAIRASGRSKGDPPLSTVLKNNAGKTASGRSKGIHHLSTVLKGQRNNRENNSLEKQNHSRAVESCQSHFRPLAVAVESFLWGFLPAYSPNKNQKQASGRKAFMTFRPARKVVESNPFAFQPA